ncbi:MAG: HAD family hydrolase [Bacteroidota bacterium]
MLLILDVDETLIHATKMPLAQPADFHIADFHVYQRPYLVEFIRQLHVHYTLAIWSSASDAYVEAVIGEIMPKDVELAFVWGRSRCTYRRSMKTDLYGHFSEPDRYVKPLKKLKRLGYPLERMLIVDDSPHKSAANYGNAIYPKKFLGDPADDELLYLASYLLRLKDEANVRLIEKRNWRKEIE